MRHPFSKVPEITIYFWIAKILTTAMGEAVSDWSVKAFVPELAVLGGFVLFAVSMVVQLASRRYNALAYWFAVSMVSIFGTMAADVVHIGLGVPYIISSVFFAVTLIVIFSWWYRREHTLSIHSIYSRHRELFYWAAILATFALGTASGDLTASTLHLGYLHSGYLFIACFIIPLVLYYLGRAQVLTFWLAYIVTRPLGASFADWLGKPVSIGGVGFGEGAIGLTLATAIVVIVLFFAISRIDVEPRKAFK